MYGRYNAIPSEWQANIRSQCPDHSFTEEEARAAVAKALCWSDALRALAARGSQHPDPAKECK
ncbi:MAG TPA: hypothetical protein VE727_01020, partial [Solirubrobacterales bacterium]|nr:hypothetical protein [Solirubrobacterales bacterium]